MVQEDHIQSSEEAVVAAAMYFTWCREQGIHIESIYPGNRERGGKEALFPQGWSLRAHPNYSLLPVRLRLLKVPQSSKTVPPCTRQGFKHVSLWSKFTVKPFMVFSPAAQGQLAELRGCQV